MSPIFKPVFFAALMVILAACSDLYETDGEEPTVTIPPFTLRLAPGLGIENLIVVVGLKGLGKFWRRRGSPEGTSFVPTTSAGGNVVVAGTTWTTGPFNYSLVKFDPSGYQLWSLEYDHASGTRDFAFGLSLDHTGSIYLTGSSRVGIIGLDTCVTIKVDPEGSLVWTTSFSRPDGGSIHGREVFVDDNGNVSVLGGGAGPVNGLDIHALRYLQIPVDVVGTNEVPSGEPLLRQNFPNPFNPTTTIRFSIPRSGEVSLKIFNLLGEEVATLVSGNRDAGAHTIQWDATGQPSGVYFCRILTNDFVQTRKLVLLR